MLISCRTVPCQYFEYIPESSPRSKPNLTAFILKWTAELAPRGYGPILSWFCGYFNTIGWCVVSASVTIITGQFIMAMAILCYPEIEYRRWHGFLIYQFFSMIFTVVNIFGRKISPLVNKFGLIFCVTSFLTINLTLLGTASPKNSSKFVFTNFVNNTGWKSDGIAFIVGLTNPAFSFGGYNMTDSLPSRGFPIGHC